MMAPGKSVDGYELHFAVNHLAHFLLTNLLLDLMKKAPSARVINVSSINHRRMRETMTLVLSESTLGSAFGFYSFEM